MRTLSIGEQTILLRDRVSACTNSLNRVFPKLKSSNSSLMARYSNLFHSPDPPLTLQQTISKILRSCDLDLVYETTDYLIAQEKPGQVSYSQLTRVEVLISAPTLEQRQTRIDLVVKNEELPLKINNHCQQIFELVNRAIAELECWQPA